ncbi:hypothetical protein D3C80_162970 [compost metagenome]
MDTKGGNAHFRKARYGTRMILRAGFRADLHHQLLIVKLTCTVTKFLAPGGGLGTGDARRTRSVTSFSSSATPDNLASSGNMTALLVGEGLPTIGILLGHMQVQTTAREDQFAAHPV